VRALLVVLAGCSAALHLGTSSTATPPPAATEPAEPAEESHGIPGAFVKSQLEQLPGKTPAEARQLFVRWGHDGKLTIEPSKDFYPSCQAGRICDWNIVGVGRAYSASVHDDVILYTQKAAPQVTAPPP